jgi:hypothetical protein
VLWIYELIAVLLVKYGGEIAVLPAVTTILLHHNGINTWTYCSVLSTGQRINGGSACSYCSIVTSLCNGYMD